MVELKTYRLLSIFHASNSAASDTSLPDYPEWWEWYTEFERAEASRLLISIAVMARNGFDSGQTSGKIAQSAANAIVGELTADLENPSDQKELTCREACNKIIHTDRFELERNDEPDRSSLTGVVLLFGSYRGHDWKARVRINDFAVSTVNLIPS